MAKNVLPLFPLNVVLFPYSALALHIFEERYKTLIGECLEEDGKEFGINFVEDKKLSLVGCTAVVRNVVQQYGDGRLDIVVEGRRRYDIRRVDEQAAPYFVGHVTFFGEESEAVDIVLVQETVGLYDRFMKVVYKSQLPTLSDNPSVRNRSFIMGQKAVMDLRQRQQLLEMKSENRRLRMLRGYFMAVIPKLQHAEEIHRIVNSDGYIIN
jgi:Lon protease-like protein